MLDPKTKAGVISAGTLLFAAIAGYMFMKSPQKTTPVTPQKLVSSSVPATMSSDIIQPAQATFTFVKCRSCFPEYKAATDTVTGYLVLNGVKTTIETVTVDSTKTTITMSVSIPADKFFDHNFNSEVTSTSKKWGTQNNRFGLVLPYAVNPVTGEAHPVSAAETRERAAALSAASAGVR